MRDKLVIHVGYPKTATSTLQKYLFERHREINNLGYPFFHQKDIKKAFEIIRLGDYFFYERKKKWIKTVFESLPEQCGKIDVFSSEDITGVTEEKINTEDLSSNIVCTISRMKEVFTDIYKEILVVVGIRKQDDLFFSRYAHGIRLGVNNKNETLQSVIAKGVANPHVGVFSTQFYTKHINSLVENFGIKNIHIIVFEQFISDKKKIINNLSGFIGIDKEEALNLIGDHRENSKKKIEGNYLVERNLYEIIAQIKMIALCKKKIFKDKKIPFFIENKINYFLSFYIKKNIVSISQVEREKVMDIYREDNRLLSSLYNIDIERYGYC